MARINVGNDLADPKLAPGWKVSDDGFGLRTCSATYNADEGSGFDFNRGEDFPVTEYGYLKLHKQTSTFNAGGMQSQVCDYVGIDPDVNGGDYTNPQVSSSNGLTSEPITTNPNFRSGGGDGYGGPIAGSSYNQSSLGPVVSYMDPDTDKKMSRKSYIGLHGACFENENGGRFIGFVDPGYSYFYGKTNYLAPQTSFAGHFYTNDPATVVTALAYLGTTSYDNDWGGTLPDLVPRYAGTSFHAPGSGYDQLLLSQVNISDFGSLFKVMYEVRYSVQGWPSEVYRLSSTA
jgi:hypothetical protein